MAQIKNTLQKYGLVAKGLHWGMALIIIALIAIGLYMVELPIGIKKLKFYKWHKEWGILVLILAIIRIGWRWLNIIPPLPHHLPRWQQLAAHSTHYILYFLIMAMPLSGWMLSSAAGLSVSFFGLFTLPDLISANEHTRIILTQLHHWLGYGLILFVGAHLGAALYHHFIYKDDILKRMLP